LSKAGRIAKPKTFLFVMPGFTPGIHVFFRAKPFGAKPFGAKPFWFEDVDGRNKSGRDVPADDPAFCAHPERG
jgi:hypothetical protein